MMSCDFLSVPYKKASSVNFANILKNLINAQYGHLVANDCEGLLKTIETLRNKVCVKGDQYYPTAEELAELVFIFLRDIVKFIFN